MRPEELTALVELGAQTAGGEVVTHALSRDVVLPHSGGTAVLITLDNGRDHSRPSTLGPRGLGELGAALDAARARDDIAAIALTGKPFILAAGADLSGLAKITERDQALAIARIGHAVLDKLHGASVPTFAFINGMALGGGLEVTLHCDYRTVSRAAAGIALPECFLGMFPAWGGAYLLPNLIGPDRAVQVIIENSLSQNTMLNGAQAYELGIADALFDGADFLERSLDWAGRVVAGTLTIERPQIDRGDAWDAALARGKAFADRKVFGASPGPYRALQLMAEAKTAERTTAYAAEDEGLADLIMGSELRASLYAFELVRKRARKPAGAPDAQLARPITKIGIVGAGLMASQLALLFLRRARVPVVITDLDQERVDRGLGYVHAEIDKLQAKKRTSTDGANRMRALISGTTDLADFADCDFVIEAVFEEISIKKQVFADLEKQVGDLCVLATNTSSLSVAEMAADLQHPERLIGFHFFNPVAVMPLLEVVRAPNTDDETVATALNLAKTTKKNAVLVKDATGFVVNRHPAPTAGRHLRRGRRRDPGRGGGRRHAPARNADAAVRAAATRRSGRRSARRRESPCLVRRSLPGLPRPQGDRQREEAWRLRLDPGGQAVRVRTDPGPSRLRRSAEHSGSGPRAGRARTGRRDRPDARRGGRRVPDGHRPVPDPRRRLALPPGRHHPVPGSRRSVRGGRRSTFPAARRGFGRRRGLASRPMM